MGIRSKLIFPIAAACMVLAIFIHFIWLPHYIEEKNQSVISYQHENLEILGIALVPSLLTHDLAQLYSTLNYMLQSNQGWQKLQLKSNRGTYLYPLKPIKIENGTPAADWLSHSVEYRGEALATLQLKVNIAKLIADEVNKIRVLEALLISILIIVTLLAVFVQDRIIRRPLKSLSTAVSGLSGSVEDLDLPKSQNDEIGELIEAFRIMRKNLSAREKNIKEHTQALRERETRMRAIFENVVDGIITTDRNGNIESFNKAAETMFGYTGKEIQGKNVSILVSDEHAGRHHGYLEQYHNGKPSKIIGCGREVEGRRRNGETFPLEVAVTVMHINDELMFCAILRDRTEQIKIDKMKNEFVSTVSHELRTPLTSIGGSLGLVLGGVAGELPEKAHSLLIMANENVQRLTYLINDILDMEKIESGKMEFKFTSVNVADFLDQVARENQSYADQHQVTIHIHCNLEDEEIFTDPDRLMQVMNNLVSNAIKHSEPGMSVEISAKAMEDHIRFAVKDTGTGIPKDFQKTIYNKFTQLDSSDSRKRGGTGLGLSITKAILDQQGVAIQFDTQEGGGTTFYFEFKKYVCMVA